MRTSGGHSEHMRTLETMSHGHYKHWSRQHNSYFTPAMRETCWLVCKSDNLQIPSSQESSGSVQRSLSVDISQDYRVLLVVKSENMTQGDNNNGTM